MFLEMLRRDSVLHEIRFDLFDHGVWTLLELELAVLAPVESAVRAQMILLIVEVVHLASVVDLVGFGLAVDHGDFLLQRTRAELDRLFLGGEKSRDTCLMRGRESAGAVSARGAWEG